MQDIRHSNIESTAGGGGGGGRLFAAGAGNRQLRPPHHHHHHHHDLKCPRCDSSNTKFCYYNNYNLSQPRHFCKSCRRYWTNGGVLRNVPVGGGVRKAKRSGKPKSKPIVSNSSSAVASDPLDPDLGHRSTNSENSSSDSCSRTATATATANTTPITTTTAEVSGSNSTNSTPPPPVLLNFNESSSTQLFNVPRSQSPIATVDPVILSQSYGGNTSSSEMRTFAGLMSSWKDDQLPLDGIEKTEDVVEMQGDVKMAGNWEENVDDDDDEGLFDHSYWNQSQWNDDDDHHNHLLNYLP